MIGKESLKISAPRAADFSGRQEEPCLKYDYLVLRPLKTMLKDLIEFEAEDWFRYAFSRELLNRRFNDNQRRDWTLKALNCGRVFARRIIQKYGCSNPEELAELMGLNIFYFSYPKETDRILFAEYKAPDTICIYLNVVNKAERLLKYDEIREILTDRLNIRKLLLAHEIFHHIEKMYKNEIYTLKEKIRLWSVGPIHNDSTITAISEIAAMAFAQEMTQIPYFPYVLDIFLMYSILPEKASELYKEVAGDVGIKFCDPEQ